MGPTSPIFTIIIEDLQRRLLIDALTVYLASDTSLDVGRIDPHEGEMMLGMLQDLPEIEKTNPGTTHGLCY